MKNTTDKKQIEFKLSEIIEKNFCLHESITTLKELDDSKLIVQLGYKFELDKDLVTVSLITKYNYPDDKNEEKSILELWIDYVFYVNNKEEYIKKEKDKIIDKGGIFPVLLGIAIGTSRGIIFSKTSSTILAKYPLPAYDPQKMIEKGQIK
jgi:hypothetical protein